MAGLQKKVKRRRRRRRMMMKRRKKKKSTVSRGERCLAQCWKRGQRGVRRKGLGEGSGRRAPEVDQERCCLWCSASGGVYQYSWKKIMKRRRKKKWTRRAE